MSYLIYHITLIYSMQNLDQSIHSIILLLYFLVEGCRSRGQGLFSLSPSNSELSLRSLWASGVSV